MLVYSLLSRSPHSTLYRTLFHFGRVIDLRKVTVSKVGESTRR